MISTINSVGAQAINMQAAQRAQSHQEMFTKTDTNEDGYIDQQELEEMFANAPEPPAHGMQGMQGPPPARPAPPDASQMINQFDQDGDGQMNLDELKNMGDFLRAQMDAMAATNIYSLMSDDTSSTLTASLIDTTG